MSSRGGKPRLRQCPASTKDKPQSGRSPGSRVSALAPPSQFHGFPFRQWHLEQKLAGYSCGNSAGFSSASLLSTLSRRPGAYQWASWLFEGEQGAAPPAISAAFCRAAAYPKIAGPRALASCALWRSQSSGIKGYYAHPQFPDKRAGRHDRRAPDRR